MTKNKSSYGIACIKYIDRTPHILMIKKKYTHAFREFMYGTYDIRDPSSIVRLLSMTTCAEKLDILSLNFDRIWFRVTLSGVPQNPNTEIFNNFRQRNGANDAFSNFRHRNSSNNWRAARDRGSSAWNLYNRCRGTFLRNFIDTDRGMSLINWVKASENAEPIWEIPKGRPYAGELPMNTAIREFKEEANADIDDYDLQFGLHPIVQSYTSNDCTYHAHYFLALANDKYKPIINFENHEQLMEVDNIRWISLEEIKYLNGGQKNRKRIFTLCQQVIHAIKKKVKYHKFATSKLVAS